MSDLINHPPHYRASNGIEVIDVVEGFELNHRMANSVEYILRADRKGTALADLRKAKFYLDREIEKRGGVEHVKPAPVAARAMPGPPLYYLATPYTKYHMGVEVAASTAASIAGALMKDGLAIYCPIAHSHQIAVRGGIDPLDHSFWLPFNEAMLARCDALLVTHMEGWEKSRGIAEEVEFFERGGKPIFDLYPSDLKTMRRRALTVPEQGGASI